MGKDIEKHGSDELGDEDHKKKGLSQERKEDLQTYCTLCLVVLLGTIITIIKIVTIDINDPDFSSIFSPNENISMNEIESNISSPISEPSSSR